MGFAPESRVLQAEGPYEPDEEGMLSGRVECKFSAVPPAVTRSFLVPGVFT